MIWIPTDRTCNMQSNLREECKQCRNLIGYYFCWMIMSVVHQWQTFVFVHCSVAQWEFSWPYCISLNTDTEYFRLYTRFYKVCVKWLGKDCIDRLLVAYTRSHTVSRNIFESVTCPDIHYTRNSCLLRKILWNADAGFSMLDPEVSYFLIRAWKCKSVFYHWMWEECWIKIKSHFSFFCKINPFLEMFWL